MFSRVAVISLISPLLATDKRYKLLRMGKREQTDSKPESSIEQVPERASKQVAEGEVISRSQNDAVESTSQLKEQHESSNAGREVDKLVLTNNGWEKNGQAESNHNIPNPTQHFDSIESHLHDEYDDYSISSNSDLRGDVTDQLRNQNRDKKVKLLRMGKRLTQYALREKEAALRHGDVIKRLTLMRMG